MTLFRAGSIALMVLALAPAVHAAAEAPKTLHDFTLDNIDGEATELSDYEGKVVLVVNVASKCGFTPQYAGLQDLYETYKDKGFVVLGMPANNFRNQEPGTEKEIKRFCTTQFGVTFPMFSKISVRGEDIHPLYAWLTDKKAHPETGGPIGWNFTKFLVAPDGQVIARFNTRVKPKDDRVIEAIEKALKKTK